MNIKRVFTFLLLVTAVTLYCGGMVLGEEPVDIMATGDLIVSMTNDCPVPISLRDGPVTCSFTPFIDPSSPALPADEFIYQVGGHIPETFPDETPYPHTYDLDDLFGDGTVGTFLWVNNTLWVGSGHSNPQNQTENLVTLRIPIENLTFTNTSTNPFEQRFDLTYNLSEYRGIPTRYIWNISKESGESVYSNIETTEPTLTRSFPVLDYEATYWVNVTASNTSAYVEPNESDNLIIVPTVENLLTPNFTYTIEDCPAFPVEVQFKDNSSPDSYLKVDAQRWNFGDLVIVDQINASHLYMLPNTYTVNYTAYNTSANYNRSIEQTVDISGLLSQFTYTMNPTNGRIIDRNVGVIVNFTNTSLGVVSNYLWYFGEPAGGDSVIGPNASHAYKTAGTYNPTLTVTSPCGSQNISTQTIVIGEVLTANFTWQPRSGNFPLSVQFIDQSTDNPSFWEWFIYYSNGTVLNHTYGGTEKERNPIITFPAAGSYRATLTVTNIEGATSGPISKDVILSNGILADFTGTPKYGYFPLNVSFTDLSTPSGQATTWDWTFGDDKPGSNLQNPYHLYERKGNFTVALTSGNSESSNTSVKGAFICVGTQISPDFTPHGNTSARSPFVVNFTDASTPADEVSSWIWTFPDGSQQSGRTISHEFATIGKYNITLNVSSLYDSRNVTYEVNLTEIKEPMADFYFAPGQYNAGDPVKFYDRSAGTLPLNYSWSFGDGGASNESSPNYVYQYAGKYYPSLQVTNIYGSSTKNSTTPVYVRGPVIPSFTSDKPDWWAMIGQQVTFYDTSKGQPEKWTWDFGDGIIETVDVPQVTHTYSRIGIHNVTMAATNWNGATGIAFHPFEVSDKSRPRDISFVVVGMNYTVQRNSTVHFNQTIPNQSNISELFWEFGDGTNYFGNVSDPFALSPNHTYINPGQYTVTLSARNDVGVNERTRVAFVVVL